jgi:hypothetical protein
MFGRVGSLMGSRQLVARSTRLDQTWRSSGYPCLHARFLRVYHTDTTSHQHAEAPCAKERHSRRVRLSNASEQRSAIPKPHQVGEKSAADTSTPSVRRHEHNDEVPRGMPCVPKQRPDPDDLVIAHIDQGSPPPSFTVQVGTVDS